MQIYDSPESELKLNDVFEFVGVLTFDSEIPVETGDRDDFCNDYSDDLLVHLPPHKVSELPFLLFQHPPVVVMHHLL